MRTSLTGVGERRVPARADGRRRRSRAPGGARGRHIPVTLIVFAAFVGLSELVIRLMDVPPFILPVPSSVFRALFSQPEVYLPATAATLMEALGGLALAAGAAFGFAVAALFSRFLDRLLTPFVVLSQTIPVITLAPLLVLWFGYGALPRVVVCALVAFFPMAMTALEGLRSTDPQLLVLLRSVDASRWDTFWRVRVPHAGPFWIAGVRTGATLSLVGAVVAEWTGSDQGLGYLVLSANSRLATAQAFAAVLVICLLGLAIYACTHLLDRRVGWWSRLETRKDRNGK